MRALVTGGTGFVGSWVVRVLLAAGVQVSCLVRSSSSLANLQGIDIILVQGDLSDPASLGEALRGCQQLYHVAAYYSTRPEDAEQMFRVNVEGTRNLLTAAAEGEVERIIHTSTIGTIGRPADGRLPTKRDLFQGVERASAYVRSKLEGEQIALDLAAQGAPIVVVNPCAPVGGRDIVPSSTGARIIAYLAGREPSFPAGGINFVSVEDVAQGHLLAAQRGRSGERYILGHAQGNLGLDEFYALMEQVAGVRRPGQGHGRGIQQIRRALGRLVRRGSPPQAAPVGFRPAALTADPSRAIHELGLPQTPLEVAFRQAVVWFRAQRYVLADKEHLEPAGIHYPPPDHDRPHAAFHRTGHRRPMLAPGRGNAWPLQGSASPGPSHPPPVHLAAGTDLLSAPGYRPALFYRRWGDDFRPS